MARKRATDMYISCGSSRTMFVGIQEVALDERDNGRVLVALVGFFGEVRASLEDIGSGV
jgi:hypothetical protein